MKTITKMRISLGLVGLFLFAPALQAQINLANATDNNIAYTALDDATGDFYVGTVDPAGDFPNIVRINFPDSSDTTLTTTTMHTGANGDTISSMALSRSGTTTRVCYNLSAAAVVGDIEKLQVTDGTTDGIMGTRITDGAGAANGLVKTIAANSTHIFAAVRPAANDWLQATATSGVTSHSITVGTLDPSNALSTISILTAAGQDLAIQAAAGALGTTPLMVYDPVFQKIYLGVNVATTGLVLGDGVRSLIIIDASDPGALAKVDIKTNPTLTWGQAANDATASQNTIVGTLTNGPAARSLSMHNLGIMHTSTGYSYLIVNGGNGPANETGNTVWALPLVTKGFSHEGTLADINSPGFNTQANLLASLATEGHIAAMVGDNTAPWAAVTAPNQMQIIGDCVYLSQQDNTLNTNQAGVVYSQAIFGQEGKIVRWTRWTRAVPVGLGNNAADGNVFAFGVDGRSGRTWAVPGGTLTSVRLSTWEDASDIATGLDTNAAAGVYCSYNLNNTSQNFGNNTIGRYSVFGGDEVVIFTRTGAADADPAGIYNKPENTYQTAFVVGVNDDNIRVTNLPDGAGEVRCLGYSHWALGAAQGFFFAGTDAGLYVYTTAAGLGIDFDAVPADALNAAPWLDTNIWTLTEVVVGSVRKIKSIGGKVYILARDNSGTTTVDRLYGVSVQVSLADITANMETLAVTNTGNLSDVDLIVDFDIIRANPTSPTATATGDGAIEEQVVLLTNNGVYQSKAVAGLQDVANDTQALALWAEVAHIPANGVFSSFDTSSPSSLTLMEIASAAGSNDTFMRSNLRSGYVDGATLAVNSSIFNSNSSTLFLTLDRITDYWSDGGRRFFVYTAEDGSSTFASLPYDVSTYNMTTQYGTSNEISGKTLHNLGLMSNGHSLAIGGADELIII